MALAWLRVGWEVAGGGHRLWGSRFIGAGVSVEGPREPRDETQQNRLKQRKIKIQEKYERKREEKPPEKLVHPVFGPGSQGRPFPRSQCRLTEAAAAPRLPPGWLEVEGEGGEGRPQPGGQQAGV